MGKLDAAERKRLPKSDFGLPAKKGKGGENKAGRGAYPMPDKKHARVAKAYASKEEHAGKLSKSAEEKIDAKANRKLGEKGDKAKSTVTPKHERDRVEVRKVANGYMVRHTSHHPTRGYMESEHYTDEAPKIRVNKGKR